MAIRNASELKVKQALDSKTRLPRDRYTVRCKKEEFTMSKSSGNPMVVRTWEIVAPESFKDGNKEVVVAGTELTQYLPIANKEDKEKADKSVARYLEENRKLGLPCDSVDDENPAMVAEGVVAEAILSSEEQLQRKELTVENRAAGKTMGDAIKDADGNDIKRFVARLEQILGKSSTTVNAPY